MNFSSNAIPLQDWQTQVNNVTSCPALTHRLATSLVKTSAPPIAGLTQQRQLKTKIRIT